MTSANPSEYVSALLNAVVAETTALPPVIAFAKLLVFNYARRVIRSDMQSPAGVNNVEIVVPVKTVSVEGTVVT